MHLACQSGFDNGRPGSVSLLDLATAESRSGMSAIVLLVTQDCYLEMRLRNCMSDWSGCHLTILSVDTMTEAIERLDANDSIDAVILDCDLSGARELEPLHLMISASPHVPVILLGNDRSLLEQMNLVEYGVQDYLLKRHLNAETLVSVLFIAIARNYRYFRQFCQQAGIGGRREIRTHG